MSGLLGRLSGGKGSFATDSRAVSNLVGFILLFSILLLALAGWQAQVVPQETAQSEFQHHQTVQDELIDFRNAVFETATDDGSSFGASRATSVTLGTTHPSRTLTIGPPSSAGWLQTSESYNVTIQNTRTNRTEEVPTRFVEYSPEYLEYRVDSIWYENSMLYLEDDDATEPIVLADQQLAVDGRTVRVVPTQNEISENGIEATSIETYAAEAVERNPELYEADTRRMQIVVPTRLNRTEYWGSELNDTVQHNTTDDFYDSGVHALEILVEPDIEVNTVGFQGGPTENPQRSTSFVDRDLVSSGSNMSGDGDEESPYVIMSSDHLQNISDEPDAFYELGGNIDASDTSGDDFEPIEDFSGELDGNGYMVSELTIERVGEDDVGLFASVDDDAKIKNLGLESVYISGDNRVGGLAGINEGEISTVYVNGTVEGADKVGGLVGHQTENDIKNSYTGGHVSGEEWVGGLVGDSENPDNRIQYSHSTATVEMTDGFAGGLAGRIVASVTIENSFATGDVEGDDNNVGGLVGVNDGEINNTYATGDVDGNANDVGGLVGWNSIGEISNSYATGAVEGEFNQVGGLIGVNTEGDIGNSYWDEGTTNREEGIGNEDDDDFDIEGFGETDDATPASNMTGEAAKTYMTGFDFADDWQSPNDWRVLEHPDDYPMLHRQAD